MAGYTVIDFETTGLNPRRDRVVEIGVVKAAMTVRCTTPGARW